MQTDESTALDLARTILDVIPGSMTRIRKEVRAASPRNLSLAQYRILGSLSRGQSLTADIADRVGVSRAAVSVRIDALVAKGLVARTERHGDRRRVHLQLTAKGAALYGKIRSTVERNIGLRTRCLSSSECARMRKEFSRLDELMSAEGIP